MNIIHLHIIGSKIFFDLLNELNFDYILSFDKNLKYNNRELLVRIIFVEKLELTEIKSLKIVEDFSEFEASALDDSIDLEDTMTLLSDYVDSVETDSDKERLKTLLKTLYVEAQHYNEA